MATNYSKLSKYFNPSQTIDEYGSLAGGSWFYTQNKPGTKWFDRVDNNRGWTIDFNLTVNDVINSDPNRIEDKTKGIGIYVNDGKRKETINFLSQEIIFSHADEKVVFDTTAETDYRLIGKEDNLKLFVKQSSDLFYSKIADASFLTSSYRNANGLKPSVIEDSNGDMHAVWYDDGHGIGQIYYSKSSTIFSSPNSPSEESSGGIEQWSDPVLIVDGVQGIQNPSMLVDDEFNVYVIYESKIENYTSIGFVYKNNIGWSSPYYISKDVRTAKFPKMTFDTQFNIYIVWQDHRNVNPEIYLNKFDRNLQSWGDDVRLTFTEYGAEHPSISSYLDDIYVSYTYKYGGDESLISMLKYIPVVSEIYSTVFVSELSSHSRSDFSTIKVGISGNIFVVWHDNITGKYEIYSSIYNPSLEVIDESRRITKSKGGAKCPVLSEQISTGNLYIVWHDYKDERYTEFVPLDPYEEEEPYLEAYLSGVEPLEYTIYIALYDNLTKTFLSSNTGDPSVSNDDFDVYLTFEDNRSASFPSVPSSFNTELPIVYESLLIDRDGFLNTSKLFNQIRCTYYDLNRNKVDFRVGKGSISDNSPSEGGIDRDFLLTSLDFKREIRFGDFSDVLNGHFVFKNLSYYINDAVEPFSLIELSANNLSLESLSAHDIFVNNYGDIWIVGTCGMFFYVGGGVFSLGSSSDDDFSGPEGNLKSISFDKYNYMYIGKANTIIDGVSQGDGGLFYSTEHLNGFNSLLSGDITAIVFDKNNDLFLGKTDGLKIYSTLYNDGEIELTEKIINNIPTENITSIKVDENNVVWIGTRNGLYRYYKEKFIKYTTANGFPTNRINDIAIRNTAIRYVATSNGIVKMIGSGVDEIIKSEQNNLWNNNVKCVLWQEPNLLWAGTLSRVNQIFVDDIDKSYETLIYEPNVSYDIEKDDLQIFYINDEDGVVVEEDILQIYINGRIVEKGYSIGFDNSVNQFIIRFETFLHHSDIVEVVVRKDLELITSFEQDLLEKQVVGNRLQRIENIFVSKENIYLVTDGNINEVQVNDNNTNLPFDRVHLDTIPPIGKMQIPEDPQIDRSIIRVNIEASDGITGSGVESMIVSNYPNFTTDGVTPQSSVPFTNSINHDIGLSLENVITQLQFNSGSGNKIVYISEINEILAGTSSAAVLYKYDAVGDEWESKISFGTDDFIDFIVYYNEKLIVSVGNPVDVAKLYVYDYVYVDSVLDSFSHIATYPLSESRAFAHKIINNKLYIGSGIGDGNEYQSGAGNNGGKLYVFDGVTITELISDIDDNLYDISNVVGSDNLIGVTGESGFVIELDPVNQVSFIVYNDVESLVSINYLKYDDQDLIFTGGRERGIIRRTIDGNNSYDISFRTIPGKISALRVFSENNTNILYAAVGNVVYYLSTNGTWTWKYTHLEEINDIAFDSLTNNLYVISDGNITRVGHLTQDKTVYLKLIDRAGNETDLYDENGNIKDENNEDTNETQIFADSISISDLVDFVNENKIFELDELGRTVFTFRGNDKFYSADKIEEEKGVYESEIFDGTNDLVKWETFSWQSTELENTEVKTYIRTSTSSNDILLQDWIGPFDIDDASGVDISYLIGQFVQFKAELISRSKGISPVFHRASIRAIATESVHFFTTNFVLPSRIRKGIMTSQKLVPVSADVVFGFNTTNSVDWSDYQIVDENRLFNMTQIGENMRVGIKFISPSRESLDTSSFGEYGPYNLDLFANTFDFEFTNPTTSTSKFHFKIVLYEDIFFENVVAEMPSYIDQNGYSVDGELIPIEVYSLTSGQISDVLFTVPGGYNIKCDTYYYARVFYAYDIPDGTEEKDINYNLYIDDATFINGCNTSFVDDIEFKFRSTEATLKNYHFRIKFYEDSERTNEYLSKFSGNDVSGWLENNSQMSVDGVSLTYNKKATIGFLPNLEDFESNKVYYLTIHAYDEDNFVLISNSYTFKARDIESLVYCGEYIDVPIVKNFGLMVELNDNEFVTLNL